MTNHCNWLPVSGGTHLARLKCNKVNEVVVYQSLYLPTKELLTFCEAVWMQEERNHITPSVSC